MSAMDPLEVQKQVRLVRLAQSLSEGCGEDPMKQSVTGAPYWGDYFSVAEQLDRMLADPEGNLFTLVRLCVALGRHWAGEWVEEVAEW